MEPWLAIVGIGEDGVEGLSPKARALVSGARLVVGGERHLALARDLIAGEPMAWPSPLPDGVAAILARRGQPVAVLASGDPHWFGVGNLLARHVAAAETVCVPAVSALALACARVGWSSEVVSTISLGGRPLETLAPLLQPRARIIVLSADAGTPTQVAAFVSGRGFGASQMQVMEHLGGPRERVRQSRADAFALRDIANLNLTALDVQGTPAATVIPLVPGRPDELFENDGQITKREIRAAALAALAPRAGERLWDVGCGSGSIGIEWLLSDAGNEAIAIDANPERAARATRNAAALGVPRLQVMVGTAPAALAGLAAPDAVFVGGGGHDAALLDAGWTALRPGGRMVAHAVTVETEAALIAAMDRFGGAITRIALERLEPLGRLHTFRPALTVSQWLAVKS